MTTSRTTSNEGSNPMHAPRPLLALLALPALALTAACGSQASADQPTDGASTPTTEATSNSTIADEQFVDLTGKDEVVIETRDNAFVGQYVTISAGTKVTFDNRGRNPHNAVPVVSGAFEEIATEDLEPGMSASVVVDEPGEYPYYCTLHGTESAGMVGIIRVVD
jgi:plastocyanin